MFAKYDSNCLQRVTYKGDLLSHFNLGDDSSSYIVCISSCVADAKCVGA